MSKADTELYSISISDLNPELQKKVKKFNTSNDGELKLQEAIQGLVTLQKQSDNHKKTIWFLVPVLLGLIASTFGTTMLAFKLNQQTQVQGSSLVDMSGNTVAVTLEHSPIDLAAISKTPMAFTVHQLHGDSYLSSVTDVVQTTDAKRVFGTILIA